MWILSTINKKVQLLSVLFVKTLLYTPIDKCKVAQIATQLCFKFEFCSFLAKITLKSNYNMFFACSLLYVCPRTFYDCLRTFLRTFIASIMNGDCH